jgi:hypothetical protein
MGLQFEFHAFAGGTAIHPVVTTRTLTGDQAARAQAGRLAKKIEGPVDLARVGAEEWSERYLTTANPSDWHASGYRFERLA